MAKIAENKSLQELLKNADNLEAFNYLLNTSNLDLESRIKELAKNTSSLVTSPDRFNSIFSQHGWIATEDMSVPLMETALKMFDEKGLGDAESFICKSFDDNYFSLHSRRMQALWVWKDTPRPRLLQLAYEDHKQGRYHASIPVVLAQIDGISFDTNKESFFDKKSALVIPDSIAAHETGLKTLSNKTSKPRNKTRANPIDFPYRHGILHGRELAYDNELVSTKCFFTLFALRPWALKCQQVEFDKQAGNTYEEIPGFKPGDFLVERIQAILKF